ncbi:DNA-binding protein [Streptomyces goshikiensis]|uniref:DNA-binding protein n=1 Tax=Streptomyces goshikiensis TaxID=1942 RepID=UPI0036660ED6
MADLASHPGLSEQLITDLEGGRGWIDQHGILQALAAGLRVDVTELTGQPYAPFGARHAAVHAMAWYLRRHLARTGTAYGPVEDSHTEAIRRAQASGDDHQLAQVLLPLIAVSGSEAIALERTVAVSAEIAGAGLLRRLGYRDLAWSVLQRARTAGTAHEQLLAEEVRLLVSMGLSDHASLRAEQFVGSRPSADLLCATGFAHAVQGRGATATRLFDQAADHVKDDAEAAMVAVWRAGAALESGAYDELVQLPTVPDAQVPAARRAALLLLGAAGRARLGHTAQAAAQVEAALDIAPLFVRLTPLARELAHALTARPATGPVSGLLARIAGPPATN